MQVPIMLSAGQQNPQQIVSDMFPNSLQDTERIQNDHLR